MDKIYLNRAHTTDVKELSINGTTVTSTAAELNAMDSAAVVSMDTTATPDTGTCAVQLVFKDAAGVQLVIPAAGMLYLSDVATGLTNAPAEGLAVLTYGALDELVTGGTSVYTTDATGRLGMTISDGTPDSFWVVVILPDGKLLISDECAVN